MRNLRNRRLPALLAASLVGTVALGGCFGGGGLTIRNLNLQRPTLNVGETTELDIDATTSAFRHITYNVLCSRGRILPISGSENKFRYYAPWTAQAPNSQGNQQGGDTITIQVNDGYESKQQVVMVNLTGSTIVLAQGGSNNTSQPENCQLSIAAVDSSGSSLSQLRTLKDASGNAIKGTSPTISPDGRKIAYVYYPGTGSQIMTVDVSGEIQNLTGNSDGFNLDPSWSPSSQELAFSSDRSGNYDIYRISTNQQGSQPIRITSTLAKERHPCWNANMGKLNTLAVCTNVEDMKEINTAGKDVWNLFLIDISKGTYTSQLTRLTASLGQFVAEPSWKNDGDYLAFTYYGPILNNSANSQPFQRIESIRVTENGLGLPLNLNETSPTVRESCPMWSPNSGQDIAYLHTVDNGQQGGGFGILYKQSYTASGTTAESPPLTWLQDSNVPVVWRRGTQNELVGCRPFDWK